jgi:hypothetical protein
MDIESAKKSNMSNKSGLGLLPLSRPRVRQEVSKFSWRSGQNCKPWDYASACCAGVAGHTRTNHGVIEYPNYLACKERVTASIPTTFTKVILKRGS